MRKRRNLIICIIVVIALALISVGGVFAYRAARNWRRTNMAHESLVEDYPGPGDTDVAFTVKQGEGIMEVGANLVQQQIVKSADTFATYVSSNDKTLYPGTMH